MRRMFLFLLGIMFLQTSWATAPKMASVCSKQIAEQQDTILLNFDHFAQGPKYYNSGDWYVVLENDDDWEVFLNWKAPKDNYCGTFRKNKFLDDYSYIFTPDNRENGGIHFSNVIMTVSIVDINTGLQNIVIDATITGTDGNIYIVHATQEIINPKAEVEVSILDASITQDTETFTITANNADWDIALSFNSKSIIGSYNSLEAFDMSSTHFVYHDTTVISPIRLKALVAAAYVADSTLSYLAQAELLGTDTILYHLLLAVPFEAPVDTVNVVCNNMRIDDTYASVYNMMSVTASNADYQVQILYEDTSLRPGEYSEANAQVYVTDRSTNTQVEALVANMKLLQDPLTNDYSILAQVRCTDNVVYHLQLAWQIPVPTDTLALHFSHTAKASYYPQMNNDLLLINSNDRYDLDFNIVGVNLGDTFNIDNVGSYYTSLYDRQTKSTIELAQVDGVIYQSKDTTWIKAQILGFDAICYDMQLWYAVPTPIDTIQLTFDNVSFLNHLEEGYFQLVGYSDDQTRMISFTPASSIVEGTFVNDGLFGQFGKGKYDFFNDYTYLQEWNPITKQYDTYTVEKGELKVQVEENGKVTAYASVICEDAKYYSLTIHSSYERPHLDYDTQEGAVSRTYTANDRISLKDNTSKGGYIVFQATAFDQSDMLVLYFFANEVDDDITIPEGVYPINNTILAGSVLASTGVNEDNTVSPSLYTTLSDGYLEQMYFFVDGTVEVSKTEDNKLYLEVQALNSYNLPIHIVYDASATMLDRIEVDGKVSANKVLQAGQLYIIRNGEIYNSIGAHIK